MKKLFTFVLAAMAFVACTQNEVEEFSADRADVPETLTVGFEGGDTRIELNEALKTVWTEGDEVSVFYRSDINQRWQYQGETGERVGDLRCVDAGSGTPTKTTKVVIAYPYSDSYYLNTESCDIQAMLPAVQGYKVSSYGEGGNLMVSSNYYNQFSLKSVVGWLRVELTGEGQMVESITLRGNAGEQVAGELYIDTATAEATLASEMGEAGEGAGGSLIFDDTMFTEVTLDCGEGVELSAEATEFYIALPPQTFAEGMTIEINYANDNSQMLVCENSITISRNHISPINIEANEEVEIPANQLWYTATEKVEPSNTSGFNVSIISNEWDEETGEGVITLNGELTTIGDWAFSDCSSLTSVTIPDSVTTIGEAAFYYCRSLSSVTIPDSVTTIGTEAFFDCSSLTSVTIPDSVTTIGEAAFGGCSNLAEFKGKFAADGGRCLIKDNTLIAYAEASGATYTIPDSVTTIGENAFSDCSSLTSVTIGDNVTTIGNWAFYWCSSLTSVYCKATTQPTLGDGVFKYYNEETWEDVNIGCAIYVPAESVEAYKAAENWSDYAADIVGYDFEAGEEEEVPTNQLWYTATALVEPNDTLAFNVSIVSNEWDEATSEGIITFDGELTSIGDYAFVSCGLTSVTIPDSVTTIGHGAFCECSSLAEFKGKFAADGGRCLIKDNTIIAYAEASGTTYTIPDSVTTIGDEAFYWCSSLTSVTIPDSVTTIGETAFGGCSSLAEFKGKFAADGGRCLIIDGVLNAFALGCGVTEYTIPNSVTTIGNWAFGGCSSLTSVTIPNSVTTIGNFAFYDCESLSSVYCKATTPPTLGYNVFWGCDNNGSYVMLDCDIYVPAESVEAYKAATYWSDHAAKIVGYNFETGEEEEVPTNQLWYTATALVEPHNATALNVSIISNEWNETTGEGVITFDGELTTIGDSAFSKCTSLTSVTIGDNVTTIGANAFSECTSLTSVTIGDSVTTIGVQAFIYCYSLTSVTIPDSVTTIGKEAFYHCESLTSVTIPDSVTTIGNAVFYKCSSLTSVYCKATTPPSSGYYVFDSNASGRKIYVHAESVEEYKAAAYWSDYTSSIVGYDFETGKVVE